MFSGTKRPLFGQNERKQSTGVKFYVADAFRRNQEYVIAATAQIMLISSPCGTRNGLKSFGKPALAALLIAVMSFLTIAAPCAPLHQQLHHANHGDCDTCVLCTMMHGNVDCSAPALASKAFVFSFVSPAPTVHFVAPPEVDIRLGPSRAPPASLLPS